MKTTQLKKLGGVLLLASVCACACGQAPVIASFSQNGQLVATNLLLGSRASVEWASSVLGPWTNTWAGLDAVTVDANGMIQVSVPMFYRVRGFPVPAGMTIIPAPHLRPAASSRSPWVESPGGFGSTRWTCRLRRVWN